MYQLHCWVATFSKQGEVGFKGSCVKLRTDLRLGWAQLTLEGSIFSVKAQSYCAGVLLV